MIALDVKHGKSPKLMVWPWAAAHVKCAPRLIFLSYLVKKIMEINPLLISLKDLADRTETLRGYL